MKLIFIIATSLLVYLYWTELIKPWLNHKKSASKKYDPLEESNAFAAYLKVNKNTDAEDSANYLYKNLDVFKTQIGMEDTLYGALTVSITKPVLLCGKANNLKIYHPDNSVEIYSNRWKRYQTPHASVYSYATATKSAIIENID